MQAQIDRWGDSLAVRIPQALAAEAQLEEGAPVELAFVDGRLIVTPLRRTYRLALLVAAVTPQNRHAETDWGAPMGRELW